MSTAEQLRNLGSPAFADLDAASLEILAGPMRHRRYEPNELVFSAGDVADDLLIILSGRFRIGIVTPDGRELTFRNSRRGELIGEVAVLDGKERSADVTAVLRSEALLLSRKHLLDAMERHPPIAMAIVRLLCDRLRYTTGQLEGIALYTIDVRLARFLLALCKQTPAKPGEGTVSLDINQSELAALLGATRTRVNVAIGQLEDEGVIERKGGARIVCRMDRLRETALLEPD